jgi:diacylglycerol kinase family enzyme
MLLIVNPKATTVSARLQHLVVYALRGRYQVDAAETEGPNHATQLTREALGAYDLVVAFGGDGTVNEAANGLAGSQVPLAILPGGCTNVVCRMLGIPTDVVDATEHLLGLADGFEPRAIDLGRVNDRFFVSSGGVGLDADTTRWVDDHARAKSRAGPLFFGYRGLVSFEKYLRKPVRIAVEADGRRVEGVSLVVQNSDPYTYFRSRPVRVCEGAKLDSGTLSMVVLKRARQRDLPGLAWRLLSSRQPSISEHPQAESFAGLRQARVVTPDGDAIQPMPFPIQVDGDYVGDYTQAAFTVKPRGLLVAT